MSRQSNAQVQHLWANHQAGDSNNLHSDGVELKSYATVIAVWHLDQAGHPVAFVSSDGMSPTTASKHLSGLYSALRGSESFYTPAFSWGSGAPSAQECITEAAKEMESTFKTLCRSRSNLESRIEQYNERRDQIIELAARFGVEIQEIPSADVNLKEKAKELAAKDREKRQEERRRREEQQAKQREIDAAQFAEWLKGSPVHFPRSYERTPGYGFTPSWKPEHGTDYITVCGGKVVTSHGAEAPLEHVRKAVRFYQGRKHLNYEVTCTHCGHVTYYDNPAFNASGCFQEGGCGSAAFGLRKGRCLGFTFTPYHTNGHKIPLGHFTLDEIDEQGNVKAGCHRFTASEIARFIEAWKEVL